MEGPNKLEYSLLKGGLPITDHKGCVTFEAIEGENGKEETKVIWSVKYKPTYVAWMSKFIINQTFKSGLSAFKTEIEKE